MSTLVFMKVLERNPARFDRRMRALTWGRIDRIRREIASSFVRPNTDVLEIGCGTGALAALMPNAGLAWWASTSLTPCWLWRAGTLPRSSSSISVLPRSPFWGRPPSTSSSLRSRSAS